MPTTAAFDTKGRLFFGDEAEDMLEAPSVAYLRGFKMELGSETPLYMTAQADVNAKAGLLGATPPHRAAEKGRTDAVRLLPEAGAEVNGDSMWKQTPPDLAQQKENGLCVSVLREFGGKHSRSAAIADLIFRICVSGIILIGAMIGIIIATS